MKGDEGHVHKHVIERVSLHCFGKRGSGTHMTAMILVMCLILVLLYGKSLDV